MTRRTSKVAVRGSHVDKQLENEAKGFLNSIGNNTYNKRARAYYPTLKDFQSVSFNDFIRYTILQDNGEDDDDHAADDDNNSSDNSDDSDDDKKEKDQKESRKVGPGSKVDRVEGDSGDSNEAQEQEEEEKQESPSSPQNNSSSSKAEEKQEDKMKDKERAKKATTPTKAVVLERPRTRHLAKQQNGNTTKVILSPNRSSTINVDDDNNSNSRITRRQQQQQQQEEEEEKFNCSYYLHKNNKIIISEKKWSDGMAKVCLPKGFWDYSGVGNDSSGRGPKWQKGSKNGDLVIHSPIKQCCSGIGGAYEFALVTQSQMTVSDFRKKADEYRDRQVGKDVDLDMSDEHMDDLARKFWKRLGPTMEAPWYGADMDGPSLFNKQYACGWNIENLDSCLQLLTVNSSEERLPGVTSPYLYVGMWGSVFCVHTEDMNLCSINYLHAGAPKYWYAIAPQDSKRFESLASSHFAQAAQSCSEFLRHKCYLLSPTILRKAGIAFTTQVQRPGDAMITIPGSYHFGFNTGFNVAESTNFAVPEWIDSGREAKVCMCSPHSVRIDMNYFVSLHTKYEMDNEKWIANFGGKGLTYREWIIKEKKNIKDKQIQDEKNRLEQEKKREKEKRKLSTKGKTKANLIGSESSNSKSSTTKGQPRNKNKVITANTRKFVVEVVRPLPSEGTSVVSSSTASPGRQKQEEQRSPKRKRSRSTSSSSTSKKTTKKKKNKPIKEDWRLAMKTIKGSIVPQTRVLCFMAAEDVNNDDDDKDNNNINNSNKNYGGVYDQCFAGTVTEVFDGYARIHFVGLPKQDDVWLPSNSPKLFLDGGTHEKP